MPAARGVETRAAFIAHRLTGDTLEHAAAAVGVSRSTAKRWWKEYQAQSPVQPVEPIEPQNNGVIVAASQTIVTTQERIGGQLLEYVSESLETLRSQAVFGRDPDWLKRQRASDLAIFYGVIADKAVRILAALQRASD